MSRIMIMDTSSEYLIISFLDNNKLIYEYIAPGKNNHSDNLLKEIETGLKETNLEVKDFDMVICGKGPGAYTGLRVAMTVAKVFCWSLNIPLYTISSLDLMASGYLNKKGIVSINMKAKKDYVYHKIIKFNEGNIEILEDEAFLSVEDAKLVDNKYGLSYQVDNGNICYDALSISLFSEKVDNIDLLEPNYLREGM